MRRLRPFILALIACLATSCAMHNTAEVSHLYGSPMSGLAMLREGSSARASSFNRTGANRDFIELRPGETKTLADLKGAGIIRHIWCTTNANPKDPNFLRKVVLRMYWDGEESPSVEVPLGDFFGAGHAMTNEFWSLPISAGPSTGKGFNSFFSMPYANGARIELENQGEKARVIYYYYIDYVKLDKLPSGMARFHAQWRRENPTKGEDETGVPNKEFLLQGVNERIEDNYTILDAKGRGHYVGCMLYIHNLRDTREWNWYGEGDDMIFIDGEPWPPGMHGTGTEDYFCTAFCPTTEYNSPYFGSPRGGGKGWKEKISLYRFHIDDPILFNQSIRVTIEHGNANKRSDDYSSVAYWYQAEPHDASFRIPGVEERIPREMTESEQGTRSGK